MDISTGFRRELAHRSGRLRAAVATPFVVHTGLYAGSAVVLRAAGFVVFLWIARSLSVKDYAMWGLLYALQTGVTSFGLVGIIESVIGLLKTHLESSEQRRLFAAANTSFLMTSTACVGFSSLIFWVFFSAGRITAPSVAVVVLSGGLLAYASLQSQIVRLEEKHWASLCFSFLMPFAGVVGGALAFGLRKTTLSFFWGSAIGLLIGLLIARASRVGFYKLSTGRDAWQSVMVRITPFIAVTFLGWLSGYGNNYIVKIFFAPEEVARFTFVFMFSAMLQLIATAMNQVWSPKVYRMIMSQPTSDVERRNRWFFLLQGISLGSAGALLLTLYPGALRIIGGNLSRYRSVSLELTLVILAYVAIIPYWHCQNYLLTHDRGSTLMRIHLVTSLIGTAIAITLMIIVGPIGIYLGFLAQMAVRSLGTWIVARRQWPLEVGLGGVAMGSSLTLLGLFVSRVIWRS